MQKKICLLDVRKGVINRGVGKQGEAPARAEGLFFSEAISTVQHLIAQVSRLNVSPSHLGSLESHVTRTFGINMFFPSKKFFKVGCKAKANNFKIKQGGKRSQIFLLHYSLFYFSVVLSSVLEIHLMFYSPPLFFSVNLSQLKLYFSFLPINVSSRNRTQLTSRGKETNRFLIIQSDSFLLSNSVSPPLGPHYERGRERENEQYTYFCFCLASWNMVILKNQAEITPMSLCFYLLSCIIKSI